MYVIAYHAKLEDGWSIFKCRRSGEITFDAYRACFEARQLCRNGNAEVKVMCGEEQYARFYRTSKGEIVQEGGLDL